MYRALWNLLPGPTFVKVILAIVIGVGAVSYTHLTLPTTPYV